MKLSELFQDVEGKIPVTEVGQMVGLWKCNADFECRELINRELINRPIVGYNKEKDDYYIQCDEDKE